MNLKDKLTESTVLALQGKLIESNADEYFKLLDQIRKYYPNYIPPEKMGVKGLKNMLNYCKTNKQSDKHTKTNIIEPDPVSKEYSDDPDIYEEIDNKQHISFDVQEKQDRKRK